MKRSMLGKVVFTAVASYLMLNAAMVQNVYASEMVVYEEENGTLVTVGEENDAAVERMEEPDVLYAEEDQNGYINGTKNNVFWSYEAATKTITIYGSGERKNPQGSSGMPKYVDKIKFDNCTLSGDLSALFSSVRTKEFDFTGLTTKNITDMSHMFQFSYVKNLDLSCFDTSDVTDMSAMFNCCEQLETVKLGHFDTSKVTDMSCMFAVCYALKEVDVSGFDTSNVTDMGGMFNACYKLKDIDVSDFDTSNVTDMGNMFGGCHAVEKLDVSGFHTSKVKDMEDMFAGCYVLENLDVSGFDTSNVTNMNYMFGRCYKVKKLDVSHFSTVNVKDIGKMFYECSNISELDLGRFKFDSLKSGDESVEGMLLECNSLNKLKTPSDIGERTISLPGAFTDGTTYTKILSKTYQNMILTKLKVESKFADVKARQWYVPYVQYVFDKDLMNGVDETLFGIDKPITREMFATILYSYAGKPEVTVENPFDDIEDNAWYTDAVLWAYDMEIVSGTKCTLEERLFGYNTNITREQLALMMYKYNKLYNKDYNEKSWNRYSSDPLNNFADKNKVSSWANDAMKWAVYHGIISGQPGDGNTRYLSPQGEATRQECAVMIKGLRELMK